MCDLCFCTADRLAKLPTQTQHDQWQESVAEAAEVGFYDIPMEFGPRGDHWLEPENQALLIQQATYESTK